MLWDSTNSLAQTQPWHYQKAFAVWQTLIMHRKYDETPMRWGLSCLSQTYKRGNRVTWVIKPLPNVTDGRRQILGQRLGYYVFRACHLLTRTLCTCSGGSSPKHPREKGQGLLIRWKMLLAQVPAYFGCLGFSVHLGNRILISWPSCPSLPGTKYVSFPRIL